MIHTVKGLGIVNKAEIDVFRKLSCFLYDPKDVGNLISGSSVFSKSSLNIWELSFHILLKPRLKTFEHYLASMSLSCVWLLIPWTVACQASLSMGFSRQKYWSGLPFPSPGDLPDPGIEPRSTALQADSLLTKLRGKPCDKGSHS